MSSGKLYQPLLHHRGMLMPNLKYLTALSCFVPTLQMRKLRPKRFNILPKLDRGHLSGGFIHLWGLFFECFIVI